MMEDEEACLFKENGPHSHTPRPFDVLYLHSEKSISESEFWSCFIQTYFKRPLNF